jgi:hypothetical protein
MNRHDQELLDKQLWGVSSRSPQNGLLQNGIIVLMMIAVFLVGMGIGDIVHLERALPLARSDF